ncbi:hypothetical protein HanRHA438_Chr14g0646751 [Helianthus annuus]|nr:hypothetical protein HanRHA438_Chr14g0646751 [Helianthus annuus]
MDSYPHFKLDQIRHSFRGLNSEFRLHGHVNLTVISIGTRVSRVSIHCLRPKNNRKPSRQGNNFLLICRLSEFMRAAWVVKQA